MAKRRSGASAVVLALVALCTSCFDTKTTTCGALLCAPDQECAPDGTKCVLRIAIDACRGLAERDVCSYASTTGACHDGVCTPAGCGDGVIEPPEQCEGTDLDGHDCTYLGFYQPEGLSCNFDCTYNTNGCHQKCGDGTLDVAGNEQCDGADVGGKDCTSLGYYVAGTLACYPNCTLDVSGCTERCGDSHKDAPEDCDGSDLGGQTCQSVGFYDNTTALKCTQACTFDVSDCTGYCGDLSKNGPEDCDGSVPAGTTCQTLGFYTQVGSGLACTPACRFDETNCRGYCGDDVVNGSELCDGAPPAGSCVDQGFDDGVLACLGTCGYSFAGCRFDDWAGDPSPTASQLTAVWGTAANNIYAVGQFGTLLHYDGTTWTTLTSPTTQFLTGIWGSSATDIYAVGTMGTVVHYNGATWTATTIGTQDLFAVWGSGASDVFAVGDSGAVYHWNGSGWSGTTIGSGAPLLRSIWGSSGNDVHAIGYSLAGSSTIWHFNGSTWAATAEVTIASSNMYALWGSGANDVYAVGLNTTSGAGLVYHFNGAWSAMAQPATKLLSAVWGSGSTNVFAVGRSGTLIHFDGAGWSAMSSRTTLDQSGVWGSTTTGEVWSVSVSGTIQHFSGATWSTTNTGSTTSLRGVWGASATDAFAVGDNNGTSGQILRYSPAGNGWAAMTSNAASASFLGVWGTSNTNVYAVGYQGAVTGVIDHYNGSWATQTSGVSQVLYAIWGSGASDIFAVGGNGTIIHSSNGTSWSSLTSGVTQTLFAVWGSSSTDVYAGGAGVLLHSSNGTSWSAASGTTRIGQVTIHGIWGTSASNIFAVGLGGVILHFDGTTWTPMHSGTTENLFAISGSGASDIFAVGASGTLLHYDGRSWMKQPPGTGFLYGVWAAATTVFTVGEAAATPTLVRPTVTGMGPETECDDYFDNDGDGLVDGADSDCAGKVAEQCANFRDDNADGHIDCADTSGPSPCSSLLQCQNGGLCKSATAITCGAAPLTGTTVGAGTRIDTYACDGAYETGPEAYVAFTTSASKMVTVQLSGYSGDLDLVILGTGNNPSACDPFAACIGASSTTNATESVTFSAAAGETYYFAVDGYAGASSTFTLGVTCN